MSANFAHFEELAWVETAMGELTLRRRLEPTLGTEVYEVKLGEEYLMSSAFTVAEEELSHLGLAAVDGDDLDVLVGGLGLGYTAVAALADARVRSVTVVDALAPVIDWHRGHLLPVSAQLVADPRTHLVHDDFFALIRRDPLRVYDALLVDIDHTPRHTLDPSHADLYTEDGLRRLARHLAPGGVFALWSDDAPDDDFMAALGRVFATTAAHVVPFENALTGGVSTNSVYVAQ